MKKTYYYCSQNGDNSIFVIHRFLLTNQGKLFNKITYHGLLFFKSIPWPVINNLCMNILKMLYLLFYCYIRCENVVCDECLECLKSIFFIPRQNFYEIEYAWRHRIKKSLLRSGLPGLKKLKRPNLAISSFKKGQTFKWEKDQIKFFSNTICQNKSNKFWKFLKCCMFCWNLAKIGLKKYNFL